MNKMAFLKQNKKVACFLHSREKLFRLINPKFMRNSRNCGLGKNSVEFSETWLDYTLFVKQKNPDVSDRDNSLLRLHTN